MASELVTMLKEELTKQRTFLSSDEERALDRPATYEDEDDLALDRVRHRRLVFFTALRERFIQDGRPIERWRDLVRREEDAAGEPTIVSELARQVLEWAVRSSDRGAMLGGFAGRLLRWLGLALLLLAGWSWFQGAPGQVVALVAAFAAALVLTGQVVGSLAAARAGRLVQGLRAPDS
ncbi:MAG TPA: hypothetical protein VHS99_06415 [Chloroflexota bacterium]|jgi:hypothetical protein|nr:hypothetical protein [Chloroflexota bacterium]